MVLKMTEMHIRYLLPLLAFAIACNTQKEVSITPGNYRAAINLENLEDEVKAYSMTSQITFGLMEDHTFIYKVFAMGKDMEDVGRWEIRGDSLHIFSLQKGPDSAFKIVEKGNDQYEIIGPNHFVLTKEEAVEPIEKQ